MVQPTEGVIVQTAGKGHKQASALLWAADTYRKAGMCGTPDGLQRGIHLEHLADRDDALGSVGALDRVSTPVVEPTKRVGVQAASTGQKQASVSTAMGC